MPYKPPALASQYRFTGITYYHALSCTIIMNREHYILYCLSCSIIIVFKQKKNKEKSPNSPMPKVQCKFSSISLPQPNSIPFFPGMVHGQMPCGRGGGGGGGDKAFIFCSNLTCSPTHDNVLPVFRSIELT